MHLHMTNTSNLPIEVMENEFPLRIERYEMIPDSGGAGQGLMAGPHVRADVLGCDDEDDHLSLGQGEQPLAKAAGEGEHVADTVARDGVVYCVGGRTNGALAVRLGGRGDVTGTHRLWTSRKGSNVPSPILHDGKGVFQGLSQPFEAGRYHSLVISNSDVPAELEIAARTKNDGIIMGVRHRTHPVHGVQFHPESVLTPLGDRLLQNFLDLATTPVHGVFAGVAQ